MISKTMTRREAVDRSDQKWQAIVKGGAPSDNCGFCEYINDHYPITEGFGSLCEKHCPLYPDICSPYNSNALYHQWLNTGKKNLSLARQILEAVKVRGKVWIEEELKDELKIDVSLVREAIEVLDDAQGSWAAVTKTYAPLWTHPYKDAVDLLEEAIGSIGKEKPKFRPTQCPKEVPNG